MKGDESRGRWEGRVEDLRLVTGRGRYSDDMASTDGLHAAFVRSTRAHAQIARIDTAAACAAAGVVAVLAGDDMTAGGVRSVSGPPPLAGRSGGKLVAPVRPALASGRVMHVGEAIALVVATSHDAAEDAAGLVAVDLDDLPAVTDAEAALREGAPQLWPEAPGNLAVDWPGPVPDDARDAEVERILAAAHHRVRVRVVNQRISGAPLEPRAATAEFDERSQRYILRAGSQGTAPLRNQIAQAMGLEPTAIRVLSEDVGGGFGLKAPLYPEYVALLVGARRLGRRLHWRSSRSEAFLSDDQARDQVAIGELGLDRDGRFLALRAEAISNLGAYVSLNGAMIATSNFGRCFPTVYRIGHIAIGVRCAFTNTLPTGPYRGAGRPEANYLMERLVDAAARRTGLDPIELRRRNLTPPSELPYATPVGTTIDSGDFAGVLDRALAAADYGSFEERRRVACAGGKLRGIGISCFLEHAGAMTIEGVHLAFGEGGLTLSLGALSTGQGHETVFRDLLARRLGIDAGAVNLRTGDSDVDLKGMATVASRSAMTVGAAIAKACDQVIAKGRQVAARLLQAVEAETSYADGVFSVAGSTQRIGLFELAREAAAMRGRNELDESLDTGAVAEIAQTFPNGCHVAEVEIDPETGKVDLLRFTAVDDCGNVLDERIVDGQIVGAVAQGIGQALLEEVVYDGGSGQLVSGTFNDYAMPRAADVPAVDSRLHPVPATTNPLGVKGVGEAGSTGAIAAIMNAIADAVPGGRGAAIDMPATPEKVWRACRGAGFSPT